MTSSALVARRRAVASGPPSWPLPPPLAALRSEVRARLERIPTRLNEYGVDAFGLDPRWGLPFLLTLALVYRYWLRVETHGLERVPPDRVLLIANHAGNTFAWDGAMLAMALLLEGQPPRVVRGMAEHYLPEIPFFNVFMHRMGSVVGTPENCTPLLEAGEAIMVFPEGRRGFVKPWRERYRLRRFGLGFMRLALETQTPIVPVGIVGSEEQSPGLANVPWLGRLIGAPAFPLTPLFPWLGLAGFLPLPVKFRLHFGEPLLFEGDADEDDAAIEQRVALVKREVGALVAEGRATRRSWFA